MAIFIAHALADVGHDAKIAQEVVGQRDVAVTRQRNKTVGEIGIISGERSLAVVRRERWIRIGGSVGPSCSSRLAWLVNSAPEARLMSLLEKFERYPLTFGPTPIEPLPRLSAALGQPEQFAKMRH